MNKLAYHILPFEPSHQDAAMKLEKGNIQGSAVQLEILKDNFLSRAIPFDAHYAAMAMADCGEIIGSAIGASTRITINDKEEEVGFAFDTKVSPDWRGNQVGRNLAKTLYKEFFQPRQLTRTFMTAKISNLPVLKLAANTVSRTWVYPFFYLTIPTAARIRNKPGTNNHSFNVTFFNKENLSSEYYYELENGLGYYKTYKAYRLKIRKIAWPVRTGISILKIFRPSKYRGLPGQNEELSFATLYNHNSYTLHGLNDLLQRLQCEGIGQLLVCCSQDDPIYYSLKNKSINTYRYCMVTDFELNPSDKITIDVRCL